MSDLTQEQQQIIHHPLGCHARVLAVAGSGKSTTMAHRIKHLVLEYGVSPNAVRVLMFNALARKQFASHLDRTGLPEDRQPVVHTFHSFSFQVINAAVRVGVLPINTKFWLVDKTELIWLTLKRAINELEKNRRIPPGMVDPEEALQAIGLWKGSLIPPERAGSYTSPYLPMAYQQFETLRQAQSALTFDDFIPLAITLLEEQPNIYRKWCSETRHLVVDEYQDINLGQQHLIELIAGEGVDVMVVGDDDQTIYEWRGARPNYIIRDFAVVFNAQQVLDYRLSLSFRFGPTIAEYAAHVIAFNSCRVEKPLVAFNADRPGFVHVINGGYGAIKELTAQVQAMVKVDGVPPNQIIILARLYAQLDNLEAEFLAQGIPYRVDGQEPFFKRREINTLMDYIRLALDYQKPLTRQGGGWLLCVANKPSRMLSNSIIERLVQGTLQKKLSLLQGFDDLLSGRMFSLNQQQTGSIYALYTFLEKLVRRVKGEDASGLLAWMVKELDYLNYFKDYYGSGEHSDDRVHAVVNFIQYVSRLNIDAPGLLIHLAQLDTAQGRPPEELVVFTTIFRTKGLEYDYVIIPDCDENLLPYLKGEPSGVYDTAGIIQESLMSSTIESERRLFDVALTRARKGVLIGTSGIPSRFLQEMLGEVSPQVEMEVS